MAARASRKNAQPATASSRSPILSRNVTTPRPELERRLLDLLDAIDEPVSIATAIRDREGRILDFRIEFLNQAAAEWAGVPRESMIGLITGELLPQFRASGYFDTLRDVVETGRPYHHEGAMVADAITGGSWVGGMYDMRAVRLGDGYLSTWRLRVATPEPG
jgi:PAS domain-containing protein